MCGRFHYGVRIHRLYLAHVSVAFLDVNDRKEFWTAYAQRDAKSFVRILLRLEGRIEGRVQIWILQTLWHYRYLSAS